MGALQSYFRASLAFLCSISLALSPTAHALGTGDIKNTAEMAGTQGGTAYDPACTPQCAPYFYWSKITGEDLRMANDNIRITDQAIDLVSGPRPAGSCTDPAKLPLRYSQIGPHCEAVRIANKATEINAKIAASYSTAAAVCGMACYAYYVCQMNALACLAYLAALGVCLAANGSAMNKDYEGQQNLTKEAQQRVSQTQQMTSVVGNVISVNSITGANACTAASTLSAAAVIKYQNIIKASKSANKSCDAVNQQILSATNSAGVNVQFCNDNSPIGNAIIAARDSDKGGNYKAVRTTGNNGQLPEIAKNDIIDWGDMAQYQAASDLGLDLWNDLNKSKINEKAKEVGISTAQIIKALKEGQSPSDALAAIAGNDEWNKAKDSIIKTMKEVESLAVSGKLIQSEAVYASGSKTKSGMLKGKDKGTQTIQFKQPSVGGVGKSQEISFGGQMPTPIAGVSTGDDIWHGTWQGDIFRLVSQKIELNLERVDQVEYELEDNKKWAGSNLMVQLPKAQIDYSATKNRNPAALPDNPIADPTK